MLSLVLYSSSRSSSRLAAIVVVIVVVKVSVAVVVVVIVAVEQPSSSVAYSCGRTIHDVMQNTTPRELGEDALHFPL